MTKNVDTLHPLRQKYDTERQRCNDFRAGQFAVHAAGVKYLPRLSGHTDEEYAAYKKRALVYGAYSRTIDIFKGMLMRVPPTYSSNTPYELHELINDIIELIIVDGFCGVLVDYDNTQDNDVYLIDAKLPLIQLYSFQNVVNWRENFVVLHETPAVQTDEFTEKCIDRWRVLDINTAGVYRQRLYIRNPDVFDEFVQVGDDIFPLKNGAPMDYIPFAIGGDVDDLPAFVDIAQINESHYMTTAEIENACHFIGSPTPYVTGHRSQQGDTIKLGSNVFLEFPSPDTKVGILGFNGEGLSDLAARIELKEKQMSALGAKALSDTVVAETATSSKLKIGGELSVLSNIAISVSNLITQVINYAHDWAGLSSIEIEINRNFYVQKIEPQMLTALVAAYQSGAISQQTLFYNLQQGEIQPDDVTFEIEAARLGNA